MALAIVVVAVLGWQRLIGRPTVPRAPSVSAEPLVLPEPTAVPVPPSLAAPTASTLDPLAKTEPEPRPAPTPPARARPQPSGGSARGSTAASLRQTSGVLRVTALPIAEVFVDGLPAGETPIDVRVPAGNHTVRVRYPELGQGSPPRIVFVESDRTTPIFFEAR